MKIKLFVVALLVSIVFAACTKDEGEGGSSKITGKLLVKEYNEDFTVLRDTFYAPGEDIYIIYGDEEVYGDDIETNYDGTFQFNYLRKGKYTIFAYSEDSTMASSAGIVPIKKEIEIKKNGETYDIGDLEICWTTDMNDGAATIKGKVYAFDYNNDFTVFNGQYYAPEENVYIVYEDEDYYFDDIETDFDGSYKFEKLPLGNYKVYAYSRDISGDTASGVFPVIKEITITEKNQVVEVEDIIIIN